MLFGTQSPALAPPIAKVTAGSDAAVGRPIAPSATRQPLLLRAFHLLSFDDEERIDGKYAACVDIHSTYLCLAFAAWALVAGLRTLHIALAMLCAAGLVFFRRWVRGALFLATLCFVGRWFSYPTGVAPTFVGNHTYLSAIVLLSMLGVDATSRRDKAICLTTLRWLLVLVLFHAGLQKLWYGAYFHGEYLAFETTAREDLGRTLGLFLGEEERARFMSYKALAFHFDKGQLVGEAPGSYRVSSLPFVVLSNLAWSSEIAASVLMLLPRTRAFGVALCLSVVLAIEFLMHEYVFGVLFLSLLALFTRGDLNRRLRPAFVGAFIALGLGRFGVLPFHVPL